MSKSYFPVERPSKSFKLDKSKLMPRRAWIPLAATAGAISLSSCMSMFGGDDQRLSPTPLPPPPPTTAPATTTSALTAPTEVQQYADRMNAAIAKQEKEKAAKTTSANPDAPVVLASETHAEPAASGSASSSAASTSPPSPTPSSSAVAKSVDSDASHSMGSAIVPASVPPAPSEQLASAAPIAIPTAEHPSTVSGTARSPEAGTKVTAAMASMSAAVQANEATPSVSGASAASPINEANMDGALDTIRKQSQQHPQNLNYALALQLLESADTGKPDLSSLTSLNPLDQKLVSDLSSAMQALTLHPAAPNTSLADRAAPLVQAAQSWQADSDLKLPKLVLASRVDSFGVYNPIEPKFENAKRHVVIIYCEVANFATQKTDDGMYETKLAQQDTLITDDGLLVWRPNPEEVEDTSRNQRHDFYLVKKLTIPETLAIGKYTLRMSVTDKISNKISMVSMPIEIVDAK